MQHIRGVPLARILLLYARDEEAIAKELKQALSARGAEVVSHDRLMKTGSWTSALSEEMSACDLIVVLLGDGDARSRRNLLFELGVAIGTRGRERVVLISAGSVGALPSDLQGSLHMHASASDMEGLADRLLHASASDTEGVADRLLHAASAPPLLAARLDEVILATLNRLGATWKRDAAVGGVRPDLIAEMPDGRRVVLEIKAAADPTVLDIADARSQAVRVAGIAGADLGLAVFGIPHLGLEAGGAVGFADLERVLAQESDPLRKSDPLPEVLDEAKTVFVAMPFAAEYEDVYYVAMVEAARSIGAACRRLDREDYVGDVVVKLTGLIRNCDAVIADLSDANPNVLYEVGYAHALGRPAIHICSSPLGELPFDVRNWNTLGYAQGRTHALREALTTRLVAVLDS